MRLYQVALVAVAAASPIARPARASAHSRHASSPPRTTRGPRNSSATTRCRWSPDWAFRPTLARRRSVLVPDDDCERQRVHRRRSGEDGRASRCSIRRDWRRRWRRRPEVGSRASRLSVSVPFDLSKDNRSITVSLQRGRWKCDLQAYTCAAADSSAGDRPSAAELERVAGRQVGGVHQGLQPLGARAGDGQGHAAHDRWHQGLRLRDGQRRLGAQRSAGAHVVAGLEADRDVPARRTRRARHVSRVDERRWPEARRVEVSDARRQRDLPHQPRDHPPAA